MQRPGSTINDGRLGHAEVPDARAFTTTLNGNAGSALCNSRSTGAVGPSCFTGATLADNSFGSFASAATASPDHLQRHISRTITKWRWTESRISVAFLGERHKTSGSALFQRAVHYIRGERRRCIISRVFLSIPSNKLQASVDRGRFVGPTHHRWSQFLESQVRCVA